MTNLIFELLVTSFVIRNENAILHQLNEMYHIWHLDQFKQFFETVTFINVVMNSIMWGFGLIAVLSHKATNYTIFCVLMVMTIFFGILLTYLNVLNILMFILKCFTYVYVRYTMSQLYTVLMVPAS